MNMVILTNEQGESLGTQKKVSAHTEGGMLHKAFSIFVFTPERTKLLIQRRSEQKMLFSGIWANTCCSHPREEYPIEEEAQERLMEECGFTCSLAKGPSFTYKAPDPNGNGVEWEYDTILIGEVDESTELNPDPNEIAELKWITIEELEDNMRGNSEAYAPWFHIALPLILNTKYQIPNT